MPVTRTATGCAPPVSRMRRAGGGVQLARRGRGQHDLVRRGGHPAGGQDDGQPLAADRGVGVGGDGHLARLGHRDPRVVEPGDVAAGGDGAQHLAGRAEVLPVQADVALELVGLAEPGRVGGGVRDPGRERERGEHAEHPRDRADQRRPDRQRGPAASGLQREAGADQHRHRGAGPGRGRRDDGAARRALRAAGRERRGRGRGRPGQHQQRDGDPAGAQDQPVRADPRMRLEQGGRRRSASSCDATMRPADPEGGSRHRGQERRGAGRRGRLPRRHARCPQDLQVGHSGRGVARDRLADQEERGGQRRQPEGEQAGGLVSGDPAGRVTEVGQVVPDVDVRAPGHPGQIGAGTGGSPRCRP